MYIPDIMDYLLNVVEDCKVNSVCYSWAMLKPQAKQSVRQGRGRYYVPKKKAFYLKELADQLEKNLQCVKLGSKERLRLTAIASFPWREDKVYLEFKTTTPDVDNLLKPLLDSMKGKCFGDDSSIVDARIIKLSVVEAIFLVKLESLGPLGEMSYV